MARGCRLERPRLPPARERAPRAPGAHVEGGAGDGLKRPSPRPALERAPRIEEGMGQRAKTPVPAACARTRPQAPVAHVEGGTGDGLKRPSPWPALERAPRMKTPVKKQKKK